jgi:DNA-binding transcriptional LysR family regulator
MDLRRIRHFVALADALSFRRAADNLHMAQPPLTVSIQKLESVLGVKLFLRSAQGVSLTPAGRSLLTEARQLLRHAGRLREVAASAQRGTGGSLKIGFVGSTTYGMLQRLLLVFRNAYPDIELNLQEATSVTVLKRLEEGMLDVGLVRVPLLSEPRATLVELERDGFIAALPSASHLTSKPSINLTDIAEEPFVMYSPSEAAGLYSATMLACQSAGFIPRVTQQATQIQTVLALVESGLGVALIPSIMRRYVSDRIAYRTLDDIPREATIGLSLAYIADIESPAGRHFRSLALREFASTQT